MTPLWRRKQRRQLEEEIQGHLEMAKRDRGERGESPSEAERAARREFGNVALVENVTRDQWGWSWLDDLLQDLRYAARTLRKNPGFTVVAILTLALGIGANTAIFSVIDAVILRPLPFASPDRLVWLNGKFPLSDLAAVSPVDFATYRASNQSFERLGAMSYGASPANLSGDKPEQVFNPIVSAGFFDTFGIHPSLGRDFLPADEQVNLPQVAILGHGIWRRDFAADPGIIGRNIKLDGQSLTVVGVLPVDLPLLSEAQIWLPTPLRNPQMNIRMMHFLKVIGRLKPGVSLQQSQSDLDAIAAQIARQYPESNQGWTLRQRSLSEVLIGPVRPALLLISAAVGLLLLIACVNVANLLLARSITRHREFAVRAALGASRGRMIRQTLTETVVLALAGGALGVLGATWGIHALRAVGPSDLPRLDEVHISTAVLLFTTSISLLTGVVFGLIPALQVSSRQFTQGLKESGRGSAPPAHKRVSGALVVCEIAVSLTLLVSAGLVLKSFWRLIHVNPGFETSHVISARLSLNVPAYDDARRERFWKQLEERVSLLPGVQAVGATSELPLNTAIFSLVNSILLRPLPYSHPEQLVGVTGFYPKGGFAAMREQIRTMDVAAYVEGYEFNLTGLGEPVRLTGTLVSTDLFSILGADAELGRTFRAGEDLAGRNSLVILSHSLWQQRFASDPGVVGHWINLEGVQRQIVGIMPADFRFPSPQSEVWIPLDIDSRNTPGYWAGDFMPVIGRLRPGATMQQASAEIRVFQAQVSRLFPWPMPANWNAGVSVVSLQTGLVSDVRARLLILLAAVALVLLIACANVANLTLSRAAIREKEIAIRTSLGAARHRIVRQLLTESLLMAAVGGALGLFFAASGLSLLRSSLPAGTPRLAEVAVDWRVLLFTAALVIFTGIVSGIAPAFQSSRAELTQSLKAGGRGTTLSTGRHIRRALVVGELALAVLLVSAAGLLIRSLWALSHVSPGFLSESVLTARVTPNESFCSEPGRCFSFYQDLVREVRSLPGVSSAALVSTLPLGGRVNKRSADMEDYLPNSEKPAPLFWLNAVSPGYFRTMGISILRGREFAEADTSGNRAAIISAETARRFWPDRDAVGKHLRLIGQNEWCTIVGVAADVRGYDLKQNVPEWMDGIVYLPYAPGATLENGRVPAEMTLVIRSTAAGAQLQEPVRRLASSLNPDAPVSEVKPMLAILSGAVSAPRSVTSLFAAFAALALVLGVVGIYGVISFFVGQRTREFGIRIALGAQRRDVLKLVMNEGLSLTLVGTAGGLAAAFALTRFLGTLLYGVSATDPLDFAGVAILFAFVALAACYMPARRAMRVDPIDALRNE